MNTAGPTLRGSDGRHLAVGDHVTGTINSGVYVDGRVTSIALSRNNVIVWNENEAGSPRHRVGRSHRFTKQ